MAAAGGYLSGALRCFVLLMSGFICAGGVHAEQDLDSARYHRAVEYCRGDVIRPAVLSADRKILCFDGPIISPFDASQLEEGGLFVVRSQDGEGEAALAISETLLQRRATVVIYDYCLSACAAFFVFASDRTYVLKGALVAWHDAVNGFTNCRNWLRPIYEQQRDVPCGAPPVGNWHKYGAYVLARQRFYSRRSKATDAAFPPTSLYIATTLINMYLDTGVSPNVAWTLSPTSLLSFKTKIHYEAYPVNQDELDELAARLEVPLRLRVRKVIYDP
jgi:hypothetical protein